jgi:hypothetical protein
MTISLINVCKYYSGLDHQDKALEFLQKQISNQAMAEFTKLWRSPSTPSITYSDAVKRQITRLESYNNNQSSENKRLEIHPVYYSQRDNYTQPHRTCNSSANAMYLDWLRRVTRRESLGGDNGYLKTVLSIGDTTIHDVQTQAIKKYGFNTKWMTDKDFPFVEQLLKANFPVVVNILHRGTETAPKGGHIILLIADKMDHFLAHDPYGTLSSNYANFKGEDSIISKSSFKRRWQGGYRILG